MNILVLDDEKEIADLVELYLQNENYHIYKFYKSEEAINCIDTKKLDVAILDVMIEGKDGFEICKYIRQKGLKFPVIMLTAKIEDNDKIKGLTLGADDYITKPFNPLELVARVKSALRRYILYNGEKASMFWTDLETIVSNAKRFNQVQSLEWRAADVLECTLNRIKADIEFKRIRYVKE